MASEQFTYKLFKRRPGKFVPVTATAMFIDIVGFTKMGDNHSLRDVIRRLQEAINDVFEEVHWDEDYGPNEAIMLPTGDGYGIGFEPSVRDDYILTHAAKLSAKLASSGAPVRIGINKGPCWIHTDLNDQLNLAGWGVIDAQRAMACGGKSHILCTQQFAEPYLQASKDANLRLIGTFAIKGRELKLYNYSSKRFGNSSKPKLKI